MNDAALLAERLASAALLAMAPIGDGRDHVVLVAREAGAGVDVDLRDAASARVLAAWARRPDRVFVVENASVLLRRLLARGIDVRRPLCLHTLARLSGGAPDVERAPPENAASARDRADGLLASLDAAMGRVVDSGQKKVARLECLVLPAFAAMETRGLAIDVARWRALVDVEKEHARVARQETLSALGDAVDRDLFGEPLLALESDADVKVVLERALAVTLPDVSKWTLQGLAHPAAQALLRYREAYKVVSTYGDAFLSRVSATTGRIHATFDPLGASTGRVSSRDPNLQNLPSDKSFHEALAAPSGRVIVTADYATCELRILADLAGDDVFLDAFMRGEDLHSRVATTIFKKPVSKTENPELRARAKAINFGLMYGMGAPALASATELPVDEAERLLDAYFKAFPKIRRYLDGSVETALKRGYAETVLGRRLVFDPDVVRSPNARGELSRIARNMPIQGTSADMTKLAMVLVHERLRTFHDAGLVNSVHDELVVECDASEGEAVAKAVQEEMSAAHTTLLKKVPAEVDVVVGRHWGH